MARTIGFTDCRNACWQDTNGDDRSNRGARRRAPWAPARLLLCAVAMVLFTNHSAFAFDNQPPVITDFVAAHLVDDYWELSGFVLDENPGYCVIQFGGCAVGYLCDVESDGSFSLIVYLGPGEFGGVTAETTDDGGLESNVAWDWVAYH